MKNQIHKDAVLTALRERAPRSVHLAEVCVHLGLPKQERDRVLDVLEELVTLGLAKQMPGRRFRAVRRAEPRTAPRRRPHTEAVPVQGRLTMHVSGFGFVAAEDGGDDVFIPPPSVGPALHGDRVRVHARPSAKGREGTVIEALSRGKTRVGGVLRKAGGNAWIDPDDPRMRGPMLIVGKIPQDARPGLQVVTEIVRYPRLPDEVPEVEVVDVLGAPGITEVEVAKLKLRDGVIEEFPPEVLAEAGDLPDRVTRAERRDREDLRGIDLCTIDPADARDHDDALFGERLSDGGFRLLIAIADVSHYVREDTATDAEALSRGCSIYLPDRAIPMLPPELSSNLASLVPNKDRLTMAVEVELGPNGGIRSHRFIEGLMRSKARLTYDGVARALGLTEKGTREREAEKRVEMLEVLLEAARALRARRIRRGSLDFDLPEGRVVLDEGGEPVDVYRSRKDPGIREAYRLVEEMMLLANEVVATELQHQKIPAIYRTHGKPKREKVERFLVLAESLGHELDPEAAEKPKVLARFLRKMEGQPQAHALGYLLLRAMQQATYDTKNIGHFALAAKNYVHFTSPIRRYPDLQVHRVLKAFMRGEQADHEGRQKLRTIALESSRLERRAIELERDVVNLYRAVLMRDRIGEEFEARVSGVAAHGFYSSFDEPFVDALTPVEQLRDYYEMDELMLRLVGQGTGKSWALGDPVTVRLTNVSIERRELTAIPLHEEASDEDAAAARKRGSRRGRNKGDSGGGTRKRRPPGRPRRQDGQGGRGQKASPGGKGRRKRSR